MTICLSDDELAQCAQGAADAPELLSLLDHLDICSTCRERFQIHCESKPMGPVPDRTAAETTDRSLLERVKQRGASATPPGTLGETKPGARATPGAVGTRDPHDVPRLPGLVFEAFLGEGGQAAVYRARQPHVGDRTVAVKLLSIAGQPVLRAQWLRFQNEVAAYARLEHPSIVRMYDFGQCDGAQYLILEYVSGGTLRERTQQQRMAPREAAQLLATLAGAMQYAHQQGVLHRDLKPRNIFVTPAGDVKIGDFGLAALTDNELDLTRSRSPLGTKEYMSPEQATGQLDAIGPTTDIYSMGVILYELLAGRPPFVGDDLATVLEQIKHDDPVSLRSLRPGLSKDLETICGKCLRKRPEERYATARDLQSDLQRFLAGEPVVARPIRVTERTLRWIRRRPAVSALTGLASVLAVALIATGIAYLIRDARQLAEIRNERDRKDGYLSVARRTSDRYLAEMREDPRLITQGLDPLHRALLEDARELYERMAEERGTDAVTMTARAESNLALGIIAAEFGDVGEAVRLVDAAVADLESTVDSTPQTTDEARSRLALHCVALRNKGYFLTMLGEPPAARAAQEEAVGVALRLHQAVPNEPRYLLELAISQTYQGEVELDADQPVAAQQMFDRARQSFDELQSLASTAAPSPEFQGKRRYYQAMNEYNLGISIMQQRNLVDSEPLFRTANQHLQELVAEAPNVPKYQSRLARSHLNLAVCLSNTPALDEAAQHGEHAIRLMRGLVDRYPQVEENRSTLVSVYAASREISRKRGDFAAAEAAHRSGDEVARTLNRSVLLPSDARDVGQFYMQWGVAVSSNDGDAARLAYELAVEYFELVLNRAPNDVATLIQMGGCYSNLAAYAQLPQHKESNYRKAMSYFERAAILQPKHAIIHEYVRITVSKYLRLLGESNRDDEQIELYLVGARLLEGGGERAAKSRDLYRVNAAGMICNRANALRKSGQIDQALASYRQAQQLLESSAGASEAEEERERSLRIVWVGMAQAHELNAQHDLAEVAWRRAASQSAGAAQSLYAARAARAKLFQGASPEALSEIRSLAEASPDFHLLQYTVFATLAVVLDADRDQAQPIDAALRNECTACAVACLTRIGDTNVWNDPTVEDDLKRHRVFATARKVAALAGLLDELKLGDGEVGP